MGEVVFAAEFTVFGGVEDEAGSGMVVLSFDEVFEFQAGAGDGRLQIDNNPVENTIRPIAVGRKN